MPPVLASDEMKLLYLASPTAGTGKTAVASALVSLVAQQNGPPAYLKPSTNGTEQQLDSTFVSQVAGITQSTPARARPAPSGDSSPLALLQQQIEEAREQAQQNQQRLLVELPALATESREYWALCSDLVQAVEGQVVAVYPWTPVQSVDQVVAELAPLGQGLAGLVVNQVPLYRMRTAREEWEKVALRLGTPLLAMVPEDRLMAAVTAGQIAQLLDGQWVTGQERSDNLVCHVLVGANLMDAGPTYFGRHENQAVVVRGDRPDIQLAALSCPLACLVLTGGHEPIPYVFNEADQQQVPLLVVRGNTMTTMEALGDLPSRATVHHPHKATHFARLLESHGNIGNLRQLII